MIKYASQKEVIDKLKPKGTRKFKSTKEANAHVVKTLEELHQGVLESTVREHGGKRR